MMWCHHFDWRFPSQCLKMTHCSLTWHWQKNATSCAVRGDTMALWGFCVTAWPFFKTIQCSRTRSRMANSLCLNSVALHHDGLEREQYVCMFLDVQLKILDGALPCIFHKDSEMNTIKIWGNYPFKLFSCLSNPASHSSYKIANI